MRFLESWKPNDGRNNGGWRLPGSWGEVGRARRVLGLQDENGSGNWLPSKVNALGTPELRLKIRRMATLCYVYFTTM